LTYTLPKVSHGVIKKSYYWGEEFSNLQDICIDGLITFISYKGNVYEVRVRSSYRACDYYYDQNCTISIYDTINNNLIGGATYNISYLDIHEKHEIIFEIREAVRSAIIRVNIKPTDYYK
jgi:hypothetical protein